MSTPDAAAAISKGPGPIASVLGPIRGRLIVAAGLAGLGTMLTLVPLAGIALIAKIVLGGGSIATTAAMAQAQRDIGWAVAASGASVFVGMALVSVGELVSHLADNRLTHHLRLSAAQRLARVPLGWFTSRASGEVKQAMQDDIGTLHGLTAHFYTTAGRAAGAILVSVLYMFAMDWRMAIVSVLPFAGFFLFFGRAMKASETNMKAFVDGMGRINHAVIEFVNGIPVVKCFGNGSKAHGGYRRAVDAFADAFDGFTRPLVGAMANANAMIAPVDVLPFVLVAPGLSAPLQLLHFITHDLGNAASAARRVQALLETPLLEQPAPDMRQFPMAAEIRVEHVGYAYDAQRPVLSDVSFTLAPGTVTAIVGASGAGKSTLARLLLRFFDPTEGRITLGGADLRHIAASDLYRHIGFVLQEVCLIHASVRENIALGRPSASPQEIEDAARAANIHERILGLPRGYDSVIGEDAQLSGGEQQRVSIARAMLLDPPVLVLDEPTAAADAENEVAIQDALSRFAQGRTLLVIAHRLDTVMHADQILVVEDGMLREHGRHAELLSRQGRYARLWALGGYGERSEEAVVPSC